MTKAIESKESKETKEEEGELRKEWTSFLSLLQTIGEEEAEDREEEDPEEFFSLVSSSEELALLFLFHLLQKKFLFSSHRRRRKDRLFYLLGKEKEDGGDEGNGESVEAEKGRRVMREYFLYEELRIQHHLMTTPEKTDTPNDIAFKVSMTQVLNELIRNCNESRSSVCLEISDDNIECAKLLEVPVAPKGSCLRSVALPIYKELQQKSNDAMEGVFRRIQSILSTNSEESSQEVDAQPLLFYDGPPEWHTDNSLFMSRVKWSQPSQETMGFIKHALRTAQPHKILLEQREFYENAYATSNRYAHQSKVSSESFRELRLSFDTHVMLHRARNATVHLKPSATKPPSSELLTLDDFKKLCKITLPKLIISSCNRCKKFCYQECICGAKFCSLRCLAAEQASLGESDRRKGAQCSHCVGSPAELRYLTPVSWGSAPAVLPSVSA